jgi:DNA-binding NtrC family response regulator
LNGNGQLILVVDDEPGILHIAQMILKNHHYRVLCAKDGPEALVAVAQEKEPISAVLTDISMPYMDGVALIRAIRKMKPEMKFIASTGQEETRTSELHSLAVFTLLMKPYDKQGLLTAVRDALVGTAHNAV